MGGWSHELKSGARLLPACSPWRLRLLDGVRGRLCWCGLCRADAGCVGLHLAGFGSAMFCLCRLKSCDWAAEAYGESGSGLKGIFQGRLPRAGRKPARAGLRGRGGCDRGSLDRESFLREAREGILARLRLGSGGEGWPPDPMQRLFEAVGKNLVGQTGGAARPLDDLHIVDPPAGRCDALVRGEAEAELHRLSGKVRQRDS